MTTWILVSDAARARLFAGEFPEGEWSQVTDFNHPESRQPGRAGRTAEPAGRTRQGTGWRRIRSAFDPHTPPKDIEKSRFAVELADYLDRTVAARKFDVLVLVAPPRFLGLLQEQLSDQVLMRVRAAVDKDLTQLTASELRDRLAAVVFPSRGSTTRSDKRPY